MIADEVTLARLMASAQQGDKQAYTTLLQEASGWLARYYRNKLPADQIGDVVQEVLMSLHTKRSTYDPARPFLPWLAAIARYRWLDHLRKVYRREEELPAGTEAIDDGDGAAILARLSLEGLLARLSASQATAIRLCKIEGLSVSEAARKTGQSETLVKVNIHRGLRKLSALVEEAN